MKLLVTQFSPASYYLLRTRPKYFSQDPVFENFQPAFFLSFEKPSFTLV